MTLHNYRLICPSAILFFKGRSYLDSITGKFPWKLCACFSIDMVRRNAVNSLLDKYNIHGTFYIPQKNAERKVMLPGSLPHCLSDLAGLTESYFYSATHGSGCFHLWGHSWEIEEYHLWNKLEQVFRIISGHPECLYVQNKDLITCY